MSKFTVEKAKMGINNALPVNEEKPDIVEVYNNNEQQLFFKRKYYNLETNTPLPLSEIESRLKKSFHVLDKFSIEAMIDLYFIYCNWETFYKRDDSFKKYLDENIPISKSYAYDIIRILKMIIEYNDYTKESYNTTLLLEEIIEPFQNVGIIKLKCISQVKNPDSRIEVLNRVIRKEVVSIDEIININKQIIKQIDENNKVLQLEMKNNEILVNKKPILIFKEINEVGKNKIFKLLKKYYK